jgi:hypothetical protein
VIDLTIESSPPVVRDQTPATIEFLQEQLAGIIDAALPASMGNASGGWSYLARWMAWN